MKYVLAFVLLFTLAAPASADESTAEAEALLRANYGPSAQITGVIRREDGYQAPSSVVWMTTNLCQGYMVFRFLGPQCLQSAWGYGECAKLTKDGNIYPGE